MADDLHDTSGCFESCVLLHQHSSRYQESGNSFLHRIEARNSAQRSQARTMGTDHPVARRTERRSVCGQQPHLSDGGTCSGAGGLWNLKSLDAADHPILREEQDAIVRHHVQHLPHAVVLPQRRALGACRAVPASSAPAPPAHPPPITCWPFCSAVLPRQAEAECEQLSAHN